MAIHTLSDTSVTTRPGCGFAKTRAAYRVFINTCRVGPASYRLTPRAEPTPYVLCFALFSFHLLQDAEAIVAERDTTLAGLVDNIRTARGTASCDKGYCQFLAFTLSAIALLDAIDEPLRDLVEERLPSKLTAALREAGALHDDVQTYNQAKFLAIVTPHTRDHLGQGLYQAERELE